MILELLIVLPIGAIVLAYATGRSIPTPIPWHIAQRGGMLASDGMVLTLYRLVLVILAISTGALAVLSNPSGLIAFLAAGLVVWLFMDDVQRTLLDIWNAEFWRAEP